MGTGPESRNNIVNNLLHRVIPAIFIGFAGGLLVKQHCFENVVSIQDILIPGGTVLLSGAILGFMRFIRSPKEVLTQSVPTNVLKTLPDYFIFVTSFLITNNYLPRL